MTGGISFRAPMHLNLSNTRIAGRGGAKNSVPGLTARKTLGSGGKIDLRSGFPPRSVEVVVAENTAKRNLHFSLLSTDRKRIDQFADAQSSLIVLTRYNETALSIRSFFNRRILLWEGQTRPALEALAAGLTMHSGNPDALADEIVKFMGRVGKGFTPSTFGKIMAKEIRERCRLPRNGKAAIVQKLARLLMERPDHRGVSKVLRHVFELSRTEPHFSDIKVDCSREFWDAVRLGDFADVEEALTEITSHRIYSHRKPPDKAISNIHKAKGLECDSVVVMPCDGRTFPDKHDARCLLYVALSRAKNRLMFVVSRENQSPLLIL